jgi:ribose transport system ATP-binding protein
VDDSLNLERYCAEKSNRSPLLKIRGLSKQFTGTLALDHVDFDVYAGEVHALLGENGAGKSTLIKIIACMPEYVPDEGDFFFKEEHVNLSSQKLPISFIHQDLGLVESMTVAENIALVAGYKRRRGLISWSKTRDVATKILESMGSNVDPEFKISLLPAAEKSIVAIARSLAIKADLVVLDEPTATLPEDDVAFLFRILNQLRERGIGIIYVTHRLDEVFRIANRVTVLRNGKKVSTTLVKETSPEDLVLIIVGRPPSEVFIKPPLPSAEVLMEVNKIYVGNVGPVSFKLKRGEILGLVGLRGAGHQQIGRGLFVDLEISRGSVRVRGTDITVENPSEAMRLGIGFISSKRAEESLASSLFVRENVYLNPVGEKQSVVSRMKLKEERIKCTKVLKRFSIRPLDGERPVNTLSGGNQQKVVLARWFETGSKIMLLEEPTFGVDVGAKADIYTMLNHVLDEGRAVLLISSDFEEVAGICHRALIFNRGKVVAEVLHADLSIEHLTSLASGIIEQNSQNA